MYKLLKFFLKIPVRLLYPLKIIGKQNIPKDGKLIVACNHLSLMDPLLIGTIFKRQVFFVGKKELFKNKFLSWLLKKCGVICLDRDKMDIITVKQILSILKNEKILGIFPEGTRNKTQEDLLSFKEGTTMFAEKTEAKVLPIVMLQKPKLFRKTTFIIGECQQYEKGNENNTEKLRNTMLELKHSIKIKE